MAVRFVDTNIFLRYFIRDDATKAARCFEFFQRVKAGDEQATTSESVIAEVVYVLSSAKMYNVPRDRISALLLPMITLRGMRLAHATTYVRALDVYAREQIDFEDALSVAHIEREGLPAIVSYDKDFDTVQGIRREEP
jgi:predicted nucleic acid-binding protein